MTQWLWERSRAISSGTSFLILFGLFAYLQFGYFHPRVSSYPANSTFDGHGPYAPHEATERLGKLSPKQRKSYLMAEVTEDLFFPMAYSLMFAVAIAGLAPPRMPQWLIVIPFATALFDYVENTTVVAMILLYNAGKPLGIVPYIGTAATTLKTFLFIASALLSIVLGLLWFARARPMR